MKVADTWCQILLDFRLKFYYLNFEQVGRGSRVRSDWGWDQVMGSRVRWGKGVWAGSGGHPSQ